jgi:hypothetical protein
MSYAQNNLNVTLKEDRAQEINIFVKRQLQKSKAWRGAASIKGGRLLET